jgi:hypothetical protein
MNEGGQQPPDPARSIAGALVATCVEYQSSPDLTSGLFGCKLVQLLVEVCNGLIAKSGREDKT